MNQVLAMHGWAGHAGQWHHWQNTFGSLGWTWLAGERGYTHGPTRMPNWSNTDGQRMVIAHSLGLHLLPAPVLQQATAVVLLGCFAEFVPKGRAGRAVATGLRGMDSTLGTSLEAAMLGPFFENAAAPLPGSALPASPPVRGLSSDGRNRLQADLGLLATCRTLPQGWPTQADVLVVQGEQDAVVPPSSCRGLLDALDRQPHTLHRDPSWGHALITPAVLSVVIGWIETR